MNLLKWDCLDSQGLPKLLEESLGSCSEVLGNARNLLGSARKMLGSARKLLGSCSEVARKRSVVLGSCSEVARKLLESCSEAAEC